MTDASQDRQSIRADVEATVADAAARAGEAVGSAKTVASVYRDSLEDAIAERPLTAVALAIGLGFLIGVTWRR
jgi:ElaB/YqjD/DUF883 family membrane-anchored ribosome-binding protein